jgi:hypothetical protein
MYYDNTLEQFKRYGLILSLIIGLIALTNIVAQAQYPTYRGYERNNGNNRNDRYDNNYRYNALEAARQNGYRDGLNDGADAAREGDRYHPQNSGDWQKGTNGYEDRYGSKNAYRSAYRDAYMRGYREAFDRVRDRGRDRRGGYYRRNY